MRPDFTIGIIGGSGIYDMEGLEILGERRVETPFGQPSAEILLASVKGKRVAFLPRHGKGHRFNPSEVPYRANVFALKSLGVRVIYSVSAVGSLREELAPRDFVLPDQIIDRTMRRPGTFFDGMAVHVGFAEPFCRRLHDTVASAAKGLPLTLHRGGTYVCMEGPLFSTRAESELHRSWGASVIGMTAIPEAKLAREAEICYATVALVTDYDVWKDEHVSVDAVLAVLKDNSTNAKKLLVRLIETTDTDAECGCHGALANTIMTSPNLVSNETRRSLAPLLGRYLPAD